MSHLRRLAALVAVAFASPALARDLPVVQEAVDEICIIQTVGCDHCRVVFVRNGSVLATRLMTDDMLWVSHGDRFQLIWQDYWTAERVVETTRVSAWTVEEDLTQDGQDGLWWCMFRNMRDLRAPP